MISQETIELVKGKSGIVEVVGASVKLKRAGMNHVGLCPFHNEKSPSFTVSQTKGMYKCFGCGKSGDAISFVMEHENKSYPEAIAFLAIKAGIELEEQPTRKDFVKPVARLEKLGQKSLTWFEQERKISNNTLLRFKITEATEWMPQFEREVSVICFNYYRADVLTNIKFRGPKKSFKMAKDAELIFYNLDAIAGEKEIIIVEGELDCLSCHEAGLYAVVSVPNGAGTGNARLEYLDNCWSAFGDKEKIILATDNDLPGQKLRDELCRRLGVERCYQVTYPEGCKDLNDVLVKHGSAAVKEVVHGGTLWPIKGILTMDEIFPTVADWWENGYPPGAKARVHGFDSLLTFAPGQMTVVTGIPGHGKDEFCNLLMASLSQAENWPWGVLGFEETPAETVTKLQEKLTNKAFAFRRDLDHRMTQKQFEWSIAEIDRYFFFINQDEIEADIESILKLATQLVVRNGIKGLYINPWNWIEHSRPQHMTETEYVSIALTKIIKWARRYQAHVLLLAHTTKIPKDKDGKYMVPTLYNVNGSANFFNKTHNGICVYRDYAKNITDVYVQKVKQSWLGQIGFVSYQFNTMTRQYEFLTSSVQELPAASMPTLGFPDGNWKPIDDIRQPFKDDKDPF
jgi:twinkle protein